jgi:hypothetical protein
MAIADAAQVPQDAAVRLLSQELNRERKRWSAGTFNYGFTYYVTRVVLIVASSTVAAKENLSGSEGGWLLDWVPLLSLFVAVITALDTWLKPQQKWRGFMESRDKLMNLIIEFEARGDLEATVRELSKLRSDHRKSNIF